MRMLGFWIFVALIHFSDSKLTQHHVTCGSVLKLLNTRHEVRLHSHEVNYGSGSGQQSVTAVGDKTDSNSYWQVDVLERNNSPQCNRGRLIKCGQRIRLMHLVTRKNLHSHHFKSPLSDNFEVSAFGTNGAGDEVTCTYLENDIIALLVVSTKCLSHR
ncbi:unnamed protein product [Calicophoron daubneyi]|uniref:MIR domain-containing protein n=1 Tax=Calicophoron daubneyi TaxID=300641 RepID=A0AAV2TLB3_CALDB